MECKTDQQWWIIKAKFNDHLRARSFAWPCTIAWFALAKEVLFSAKDSGPNFLAWVLHIHPSCMRHTKIYFLVNVNAKKAIIHAHIHTHNKRTICIVFFPGWKQSRNVNLVSNPAVCSCNLSNNGWPWITAKYYESAFCLCVYVSMCVCEIQCFFKKKETCYHATFLQVVSSCNIFGMYAFLLSAMDADWRIFRRRRSMSCVFCEQRMLVFVAECREYFGFKKN